MRTTLHNGNDFMLSIHYSIQKMRKNGENVEMFLTTKDLI